MRGALGRSDTHTHTHTLAHRLKGGLNSEYCVNEQNTAKGHGWRGGGAGFRGARRHHVSTRGFLTHTCLWAPPGVTHTEKRGLRDSETPALRPQRTHENSAQAGLLGTGALSCPCADGPGVGGRSSRVTGPCGGPAENTGHLLRRSCLWGQAGGVHSWRQNSPF